MSNQLAMPSQQGFRPDQSRNFLQGFPSQRLSFLSESAALIICIANPFARQLFAKDTVLFPQILYRVLLLLVRPTRQHPCKKTKWIQRSLHVRTMLSLNLLTNEFLDTTRSVCRYQSHRPADTKMREKVREIARKRQRFGHLRITVLRRQGQRVNIKRIHRICREERLLVPRWRRKRLQRQSVPGSQAATRRNHRWAMDFAQDGLSNGRVFAHHDGGRHLRARGTLTSSPLFFTVWILPEQTNSASWWIESDNSRSRSRLHPSMSHSTTRSPYRHLVMDSWLEWHMSR